MIMNKNEMIAKAISEMSNEQKAQIFPPITRKNFVVRANWLGRNQIITFTNNKGQVITYNHDEALKIMSPKLSIMPCWIKRGYWSQSTNYPSVLKNTSAITNVVDAEGPSAEDIAREQSIIDQYDEMVNLAKSMKPLKPQSLKMPKPQVLANAFCTDDSPI
tara:strand:- start:437 stop:919 length:483 start_codon:yes stop_codon:yes gene_type:complete